MSLGYTQRIDSLNKNADDTLLGVRLGRVCIDKNIPVSRIASQLGVTRQTVYNWYVGTHVPNKELTPLINKLIAKYKK